MPIFQTEEVANQNGYSDLKLFEGGGDAAIMHLMFTCAIVSDLTDWGYGDRWCYKTYEAAKAALDAWDGNGGPDGWHRHPKTGRRRENGIETVWF